jgi:hypothetical protein
MFEIITMIKTNIQPNLGKILRIPLAFLVMAATFIFSAYSHVPVEIRSLSVTIRYSFVSTSICILLLTYLVLRLPEPWRLPASFTLGGALFGLALGGLWASGQSEPYVVSGLIPYNDAATYYVDASRLLDGSVLSDISSRRPISIGLLGALLGITGRNLQNATAILVFLEAVACLYLMLEVRQAKGAFAGSITFGLFFICPPIHGNNHDRNTGRCTGRTGTGFFLPRQFRKSLPFILLGLFVLTTALNVRAGLSLSCRYLYYGSAGYSAEKAGWPGNRLYWLRWWWRQVSV